MNNIIIFLASSLDEGMCDDRNSLDGIVAYLNTVLSGYNFHIELKKCEFINEWFNGIPKQEEYDQIICDSNMFVAIFQNVPETQEGTFHELKVALKSFQTKKDPKVFVYFKNFNFYEQQKIHENFSKIKEYVCRTLGHYPNVYQASDTLRFKFLMQLLGLLEMHNKLDITIQNSKVMLNSLEVADCNNLDFIQSDGKYLSLLKEQDEAISKFNMAKQKYDACNSDNELLNNFLKAGEHKLSVTNKIKEWQSKLLDSAMKMSQCTLDTSSQEISHISALFESGKRTEALQLVDTNKIDEDVLKYGEILDSMRNVMNMQIKKYRMYAAMMLSESSIPPANSLLKVSSAYEKAISIAKRFKIDDKELNDLLVEYVTFKSHYFPSEDEESVNNELFDIQQRLIQENPETYAIQLVRTLNRRINYSLQRNNYDEVEKSYFSLFKICLRYAKYDMLSLYVALAESLNKLAQFYFKIGKIKACIPLQKRSLTIRRQLMKIDSHLFTPLVALGLNELANLFYDMHRFDEAEVYYMDALSLLTQSEEIRSNSAYQPVVAKIFNNLGNIYYATRAYDKSISYYSKALDIRSSQFQANPNKYLFTLAQVYNNLGRAYQASSRNEESLACYEKSLNLFGRHSDAAQKDIEKDCGSIYNNIGTVYYQNLNLIKAEEYYKKALTVRRKLANDTEHSCCNDVATTLNNLAILYDDLSEYHLSENLYKEAIDIREKLIEEWPELYQRTYLGTVNNLAMLHMKRKKFDEAEHLMLIIRKQLEKLFLDQPGYYLRELVSNSCNLAKLNMKRGSLHEAVLYYEQALDLYGRVKGCANFDLSIAGIKYHLGVLEYKLKNFAVAKLWLNESLDMYMKQNISANNEVNKVIDNINYLISSI